MIQTGRLLALLLSLWGPLWAAVPTFRVIEKGKTPSFSKTGPRRQDLSGAVCVNGRAYLAYDGGANSEHPEIRVAALDRLTQPGAVLNRVVGQKDLEAITYHGGRFFVLSGLSRPMRTRNPSGCSQPSPWIPLDAPCGTSSPWSSGTCCWRPSASFRTGAGTPGWPPPSA